MNGMDIVEATVSVHTAGTTNSQTYQLRRRRATTDADVFSSLLTLTSGSITSSTVTINGTNDDLATGDLLYLDTDTISTTPAKGDSVVITARYP